jgi:pimeloyl-ACP methyl ester carboxylesterase
MPNFEITKLNKLEIIRHESVTEKKPTEILFVHGAWHGAWCWEFFQPYFAEKGYSSTAVSLRGHAGSEGQNRLRWSSLSDYAKDVASVINQMETKPILVGHSMGGAVIQKYLEAEDCPAAVLLASIPPKGVLKFILKVIRRHPLIYLKSITTTNLYHMVASKELATEYFFSDTMPEDQLNKYFEKLGGESFRVMFDLLFLNLPKPKKIKTPILVMGAEKDVIFSKKEVAQTAEVFKTKAEFFDMAHDVMLEEGWQAVADRILNWIGQKGL